MALDEVGRGDGGVDFKAAVVADPGAVEHQAQVVQHRADSVDLEIDGIVQRGVVFQDERPKEPGPHDVVVEVNFADLLGVCLGVAYTGFRKVLIALLEGKKTCFVPDREG